jgi:hypothetical protein
MKQLYLRHQNTIITLFFIILGIYSVIEYGISSLLISFASYYVIWVIMQPCWWHFSIWHWGLINTHQWIQNFHIFLYCFFFPFKPSAPMMVHLKHHRVFNTDSDRNTFKVNQGRAKHLLNLTHPPMRTRDPARTRKIEIPNLPFWHWCEKNHLWIFYISNLLLLLAIPKYYILCHAIPYVIGRAELVVKIHDIVWHYNYEKNFNNKPWMFLFSFSDAWHLDHHSSPLILNFGPGLYKWINPQFWYFCLIDSSVRKQTLNFKKNFIVRQ